MYSVCAVDFEVPRCYVNLTLHDLYLFCALLLSTCQIHLATNYPESTEGHIAHSRGEDLFMNARCQTPVFLCKFSLAV